MKLQKLIYYFSTIAFITSLSGCSPSTPKLESNSSPVNTNIISDSNNYQDLRNNNFPLHTTPIQKIQESQQKSMKQAQKVPILMFHYISKADKKTNRLGYNLSTDPEMFEKILKYLATKNYQSIHTEDLLHDNIPDHSIIMTFDDGHKDFYHTAWPLLKKYGFTASAGIITRKIGSKEYMNSEQIKEIAQNGIEILSHSVNHPDLSKDPHQRKEIENSKATLEQLLEKPIISFVYPSGKYNDETLQFIRNAGYKIGLTTKPGYADISNNLLELHRIRIDNRVKMETIEEKLSP